MIKERAENEKLSEESVREHLQSLVDWDYDHDAISKKFVLADFRKAVAFVNSIADIAEENDHHPDLLLSNYKNVTVTFSTHSASGVTENDFEMAAFVEGIQR